MLLINKIKKQKVASLIFLFTFLAYFIIFLIRIKFGIYGTIENLIYENMFVSFGFISTLLALYFWAYRKIEFFSISYILIPYFIFSIVLVLTPTLTSMDMYMYAMRGRIISVYGENPYLKSAADFLNDSFFRYICMSWANLKQNYGPLWSIISSLVSRIAPNNIDLTFLLYKILAFIGNSLVLLLLYLIAKLKNLEKLKIKKILFLYAWSPVFLIEFVNNAHNDVWMIVFGLVALYFYYKRKDIFIFPCLLLAILVKYVYLILVPIFLFFLVKEKRLNFRKIFFSTLICLALCLLIVLPFFNSLDALEGLMWQINLNIKANHLFGPFVLAVLSLGKTFGFLKIELALANILLFSRLVFMLSYFLNLFFKYKIVKIIANSLILFVLFVPSTTLPWYGAWFLCYLILALDIKQIVFWTSVILFAYPLVYSFGTSVLILSMVVWLFFVFMWAKKNKFILLNN
jgi:hypothetical protein